MQDVVPCPKEGSSVKFLGKASIISRNRKYKNLLSHRGEKKSRARLYEG